VTKSVDCSFILGLDLDIPIKAPPCPIFTTKQTPKVNVVFDQKACTSSSNTLTITPIPGDCADDTACSFDINLDLNVPIPKIPCPTFTRDNPVTVTSKFADCVTSNQSTLTVNTTPIPGDCHTPDTCQFDLNLDLVVPIPKIPCPTINSQQTVSVTPFYNRAGCQPKVSTFTVATTPIPGNCNTPDTCQFDFDLNLFVPMIDPPCPQFNKGNVAVTPYYNNTPPPRQSSLDITQVPNNPNCADPRQCEFDINLDLVVPIPTIPCPVFRYAGANYRTGNQFLVNNIQVIPVVNPPNNGDPCEFNIFLDVTVPAIAGQIKIGPTVLNRTVCDAEPEFKLVLSNPDVNGVQELSLDVLLPAVAKVYGGAINMGSYGSGTINVNHNDPCSPEITATITLNTSGCATSGGGNTGGGSSSGGGTQACCDSTCYYDNTCTQNCPVGTPCNPQPI
jgi:hypothetical protein